MKFTLLLTITLLLSLSSILNVSANTDNTWRFKVYLEDKEIGQHVFHVQKVSDKTYINIKADFDVKFLFINAYSYEHSNFETWSHGCLKSLRSVTNDNGEMLSVSARKNGDSYTIKTNKQTVEETGCIKSFAYWDPAFLNSHRLLNAQTGEIMPVSFKFIGNEQITIRENLVKSKHYRLITDEFTIDLWYSINDEWLALNSTTKDGSILRYEIQ